MEGNRLVDDMAVSVLVIVMETIAEYDGDCEVEDELHTVTVAGEVAEAVVDAVFMPVAVGEDDVHKDALVDPLATEVAVADEDKDGDDDGVTDDEAASDEEAVLCVLEVAVAEGDPTAELLELIVNVDIAVCV